MRHTGSMCVCACTASDKMIGMAAPKGRQRSDEPIGNTNVLYVRVTDEALAVLDAGAAALGLTRSAYAELFIRRVPVDERGLPSWTRERVDAEQLPLLPPLTDWVERIKRAKEKEAEQPAA